MSRDPLELVCKQQYSLSLATADTPLPPAWAGIFKRGRECKIIMGWNNKEYLVQGMLIPNTIPFYEILLESKLRSLSKLTVRLSHFIWI